MFQSAFLEPKSMLKCRIWSQYAHSMGFFILSPLPFKMYLYATTQPAGLWTPRTCATVPSHQPKHMQKCL